MNKSVDAQLKALESACGVVSSVGRETILFRGPDTATFLNRLLTFDIEAMAPGDAVRPYLLDARGRIQLVMHLRRVDEDLFVAHVSPGHGKDIFDRLEMYHFGEKFECALAPEWSVIQLLGPAAEATYNATMADFGDDAGSVTWSHGWCFMHPRSGFGNVEIWVRESDRATVIPRLLDNGAEMIDERALEAYRILQGQPAHPAELGAHSSPLEAGGFDGVSEGKGCYPGQEVIERTLALGRPPRRLVAVRGSAALSLGELMDKAGKGVGVLTSSTNLVPNRFIGLALIKQSAADSTEWYLADGTVVHAAHGEG